MKKLLPLLLLALSLVACNKEGTYKKALEGPWEVYKYIFRNADRTAQFKSDHPGYVITFDNTANFTELVVNPDSTTTNGTYSFSDDKEQIILITTEYKLVDTTLVPYEVKRQYTMFNLTSSHVQLRNDSTELYLRKIEEQ